MIEVWLLIDKTALNTLWPNRANTALDQAIRGFWKDSGQYEVVNVIDDGTLDQFMVDHAADISARYDWVQGPGVDALDTGYPTVPGEIVALMKDHVTSDENGDVVSTTPPTLENPNWGHVFLGQKERIFAGEFSNEFSGEFL